jgi:hypothetical protein
MKYEKGHQRTPRKNVPIKELATLYKNGMTPTELANHFNCGASTVSRRLKSLGILRTPKQSQRMTIEKGRGGSQIYKKKHGHGPCWKGGRKKNPSGYIEVWMPEHPKSSGGYVLEHRIVMERMIGRTLDKTEIIHHKNGIRDDNRPENLTIVSRNKHKGQVCCPMCGYGFCIE